MSQGGDYDDRYRQGRGPDDDPNRYGEGPGGHGDDRGRYGEKPGGYGDDRGRYGEGPPGYGDDRGRYGDDDDRWPRGDDIRRREIPSYLAPAILVTLFCCTIPGIVAIVNAAQVGSKMGRGDYSGAQTSSDQAKMWCWISFALGLVAVPLMIYFQFVVLRDQPRFR